MAGPLRCILPENGTGNSPEDQSEDTRYPRPWLGLLPRVEQALSAHGLWGLADLYLELPDFRANFDKHAEGFTDWLVAAMKAYAVRLGG